MGDWWDMMKSKFCLLHDPLTLVWNILNISYKLTYLQWCQSFKRSICCYVCIYISIYSAFLVLQVSGPLKYSVVYFRVKNGNNFICVIRFGKFCHHYILRGLAVQDFCWGRGLFRQRGGCGVGLWVIHKYKFALTAH